LFQAAAQMNMKYTILSGTESQMNSSLEKTHQYRMVLHEKLKYACAG
jgi:hypothetical protein